MSNIINFNIVGGAPPFEAILSGSTLSNLQLDSLGEYSFNGVENGYYTLIIIDSNGCTWEREIIVDPNVTTTTTTLSPNDSMVFGNAIDQLNIFNPSATNRDSQYVGYPDPNEVELYLWFKTFDGKPLKKNIVFSYIIAGRGVDADSEFEYNYMSDQTNTDIQEILSGRASKIKGQITLKKGFIESFFSYQYYRGAVNDRFEIIASSSNDFIYDELNTLYEDGVSLGIQTINRKAIKLRY